MYYALLAVSTVLFSLQIVFTQCYQRGEGAGIRASMRFNFGTAATGAVIMLIIGQFKPEFTLFACALAVLNACTTILSGYFGIKALSVVDMSTYTLFLMLGGMLLPFLFGIIFYDEDIGAAKIAAVVLLFIALLLKAEGGEKRKGISYCLLAFVLNGMNGVIAKLHQGNEEQCISSNGFLFLMDIAILVITGVILIGMRFNGGRRPFERPFSAVGSMCGFGLVNNVANFLVLIALQHLPASVQYPMITGGTIAVSFVFTLLKRQKPSLKSIFAVGLAVLATLLLL